MKRFSPVLFPGMVQSLAPFVFFGLLVLFAGAGAGAEAPGFASPDPRFTVGALVASDDFTRGTGSWKAELEKGGTVSAKDGVLRIDVPGGSSVWFKEPFSGPVLITYEATAIARGGPNDRVSDLNCFWMATDPRANGNFLQVPRSGAFADYDQLRCYYVGLGGNSNTTTRFRRYIGKAGNRPLLPEHDLGGADVLLKPNAAQRIVLIAAGPHVAYYRDGIRLFGYEDPEPYIRGWFAFRTVTSHFEIRDFRVYELSGKSE